MTTLRISELFLSLQGESRHTGRPTVFVRLTGCPLRCQYCDTAYAFYGGRTMNITTLLAQVEACGVTYVTVTGGEPLAQKGCASLLQALCARGYHVSLETSGALDIQTVDPRVMIVMDIKTPASGEAHRNLLSNLRYLKPKDEIKFVICDADDYVWSKAFIREHRLAQRCAILFSPSYQQQDARSLADWIVQDRLPVRFQLQLHKLLWGDTQAT